jgi:hypothetical protein
LSLFSCFTIDNVMIMNWQQPSANNPKLLKNI